MVERIIKLADRLGVTVDRAACEQPMANQPTGLLAGNRLSVRGLRPEAEQRLGLGIGVLRRLRRPAAASAGQNSPASPVGRSEVAHLSGT